MAFLRNAEPTRMPSIGVTIATVQTPTHQSILEASLAEYLKRVSA